MTETFHNFIFPVCCWYCLTNAENTEIEKSFVMFCWRKFPLAIVKTFTATRFTHLLFV